MITQNPQKTSAWKKPITGRRKILVCPIATSSMTLKRLPKSRIGKLALVNLANPKIQVRMIGNINPDVSRQISKLGLSHIVQVTGYIPHRQSIEEINKADLLLLIIGSGASMEGVVTGKIYEYLAAKKPILALVPEGVAAELIHSARAGIVVSPTDISAINRAIVDLYNRWRNDDLRIESNREVIEQYERHSLTARLTDIMNKMSTQG